MLRYDSVRSCNVDLADREVHLTTIAYTLCQTNEFYRDTDCNRLVLVHLEEVYMQQCVCYRMELQFLHDCCVRLAVDYEVDHVDMRSVDNLTQFAHRNSESHCYRFAVLCCLTVEVAGYQTFFSQFFRSFFSKGSALLTCYVNFFHNKMCYSKLSLMIVMP